MKSGYYLVKCAVCFKIPFFYIVIRILSFCPSVLTSVTKRCISYRYFSYTTVWNLKTLSQNLYYMLFRYCAHSISAFLFKSIWGQKVHGMLWNGVVGYQIIRTAPIFSSLLIKINWDVKWWIFWNGEGWYKCSEHCSEFFQFNRSHCNCNDAKASINLL